MVLTTSQKEKSIRKVKQPSIQKLKELIMFWESSSLGVDHLVSLKLWLVKRKGDIVKMGLT
jgi:hypothetical protein